MSEPFDVFGKGRRGRSEPKRGAEPLTHTEYVEQLRNQFLAHQAQMRALVEALDKSTDDLYETGLVRGPADDAPLAEAAVETISDWAVDHPGWDEVPERPAVLAALDQARIGRLERAALSFTHSNAPEGIHWRVTPDFDEEGTLALWYGHLYDAYGNS